MIDWKKPYGIICGAPPFPGARFEQGGKYFRGNGNEIFPPGEEPEAVEEPPVEEPAVETEPVVVEPELEVAEEPVAVPEPKSAEEAFEKAVISMAAEGQSHTDIATAFGVSRQKVTSIVRRAS